VGIEVNGHGPIAEIVVDFLPVNALPVASEDAAFGLPEVDRGALGAAAHLARLVPAHLMRAMVYTSRTATAQQLHDHGSVPRVVPRERLRDAAHEVAGEIAAKDPYIIGLASESLNGIDPVDVKRSYRFEHGFTFEINLRHAEKVAGWGADAVLVQGGEGGGHTGSVPTTRLLPQVVDRGRHPGRGRRRLFDGGGLVAALAYGASAIGMGTRFLLTSDSNVSNVVKEVYSGIVRQAGEVLERLAALQVPASPVDVRG
jgi:hypothetical protein